MSLKIRKTGVGEYGQFIKALIGGDPGSGKTLISSTFPNPLYASAEGGLMSIADRDIPYVEIKTTDTLLELKHLLDLEPHQRERMLGYPVDTVVVDTIDEIQNLLIRERLDKEHKESMQLQDWGWLGEQMKAIVRGFRNLPMNVVFTCHIKDMNDGDTGVSWVKPMLSGQMGDAIAGYVDLALVLESNIATVIKDGKTEQVEERTLITQPSRKYPFVKDRSGKLPSKLEVNFNDDFARIHEFIYGNIGTMSEGSEIEVEVPGMVKPEPKKPAAKKAAATKKAAAKPAAKPAETPVVISGDGDGYLGIAEEEVDGKTLKRFQYRVGGEIVKSRNQLDEGVLPKPDVYGGTEGNTGENIFCVECGSHLDLEQAELSRIKHRKIYCLTDFEKNNR